jgi:hypothetical protein
MSILPHLSSDLLFIIIEQVRYDTPNIIFVCKRILGECNNMARSNFIRKDDFPGWFTDYHILEICIRKTISLPKSSYFTTEPCAQSITGFKEKAKIEYNVISDIASFIPIWNIQIFELMLEFSVPENGSCGDEDKFRHVDFYMTTDELTGLPIFWGPKYVIHTVESHDAVTADNRLIRYFRFINNHDVSPMIAILKPDGHLDFVNESDGFNVIILASLDGFLIFIRQSDGSPVSIDQSRLCIMKRDDPPAEQKVEVPAALCYDQLFQLQGLAVDWSKNLDIDVCKYLANIAKYKETQLTPGFQRMMERMKCINPSEDDNWTESDMFTSSLECLTDIYAKELLKASAVVHKKYGLCNLIPQLDCSPTAEQFFISSGILDVAKINPEADINFAIAMGKPLIIVAILDHLGIEFHDTGPYNDFHGRETSVNNILPCLAIDRLLIRLDDEDLSALLFNTKKGEVTQENLHFLMSRVKISDESVRQKMLDMIDTFFKD